MVDAEVDCTTSSSFISSQESLIWKEILYELHCKDLWNSIGGHTIRYTFHSRSHKKAMSRLDRCYYSHIHNLDAASSMWIDATMLLSDHNLLVIDLREPQWSSCVPGKLSRIPLRINNSWLHTSMFKFEVCSLIQHVLSLKVSACMKWEVFVLGMQDVIRNCGKFFSNVLKSAKLEAEQIILTMTEKVDAGQLLSDKEYDKLCDAYACLQIIENNAIQSAKIRARCTEVTDLHANSRCFFDFLRAKHFRLHISMLETHSLYLRDGDSIVAYCSDHFRNLFAATYKSDEAWFTSLQDLLAFTPQKLDSHIAAACEKSISEEEVFMALKLLKNGKAPGMDGISKEFVLAFWPSLKDLLLNVCNEIWMQEKMPYSFKLGKVKLIPKVDVPKRIGDWRPITMMREFSIPIRILVHHSYEIK
ncbi:hypothetical protein KP509_03G026800 [Ceratopteris richardii]|uniref:Uncharacterized protein n=1 Tax=Ceratopteris richardii TaxID=49495 RepID=A0A8T2UYA1_CERRI|nr:hypothetical protein KP509_03G026800 [Ceratopteris richardii]